MCANHGWWECFAAPTVSSERRTILLPQLHSEEDMMKVIEYCIENYFHEPNYWRVEGALVFAIWNPNLLLRTFSSDQLKRVFYSMRQRVAQAGLGDLHIQASATYTYTGHEGELKALGFDSATGYHTGGFKSWVPGSRPPYGEGAVGAIGVWKETAARASVPFFPDCSIGWDDSPRFGARAVMATQRTPDQYERLMRAAQYFSAASSAKQKIIFLSNWNEWTEDHVLLPDTIFGYSYLEAVRRVFGG